MFVENVRRIIRAFIALIAIAVIKSDATGYLWIGAAVVILFTAVVTWLQYRKFKFHISDKELILEKGLFVKEKLNIPFERIQTVNLQQNLLQQILGLTGLKIDTAGSSKEELNVRALKKSDAIALQEALQATQQEDILEDIEQEQQAAPRQNYLTLVKLSIKQLALLGATENHVRSGLVAFALIWGYGSQLAQYFSEYADSVTDDLEANLIQAGGIGLLIFITFFIIFSVITSFVRVVFKFFNLHALLNNDSLQVKAGLVKRNEYTVPLSKIQIIQWEDNFVRRYFKFKSLRVFQGRSEEAASSKKIIEVPACFGEQQDRVMDSLFPEFKEQSVQEKFAPHKHQFIILGLILSALTLLAAGLMFFSLPWGLTVAIPLMLSAALYLCWKYVKSILLLVGNKTIYLTKGWLFKKEIYFNTYRCQGAEYRQSIFLKRRKLAHLTIHTAAGSRTVRYLKEEDCLKIYNFLLAEIEQHKGSWM